MIFLAQAHPHCHGMFFLFGSIRHPNTFTAYLLTANQFGMASMCMLGNSVFASGNTDKLCETLSKFGRVFVCTVDECGAQIIEK